MKAVPPAKRRSELRIRLLPLVRALLPKVIKALLPKSPTPFPNEMLALRSEIISDAILDAEEEQGWPGSGARLVETMRSSQALECMVLREVHR
jgi:hypothetical protein